MKSFFVIVACLLLAPSASRADDYTFVQEKDATQIYSRSVPGSGIKQVKGIGVIAAPPERVAAMLADVRSYPHLMPPTILARELKREGNSAWYYMVIDPPVVQKRDYCIKITITSLSGGGYKSTWELSNDLCPAPTSSMVRILTNAGSWIVSPVPGGSRVVYEGHSDPGGDAPTWIVNRVTANSIPDVFQVLRSAVTQDRYAHCDTCPPSR